MKRLYEDTAYGPLPLRGCYWDTTVPRPDCPRIEEDLSTEVAVIGAGYTGLNAAHELASAGVEVAVLDAENPAWGGSGRNGGFCVIGGDKLGHTALTRRYGADEAATYAAAQRASVDLVAELTKDVDVDRHSDGETLLAHRSKDARAFPALTDELKAAHGVECEVLPGHALAERGLAGPEFHGALTLPLGFALNPLKYAVSLLNKTMHSGARIYGHSPVQALERQDGKWVLVTPTARLRANKLILATNGYSSDDLPPWMEGRYLPAQSNVLVTRPLTDEELADQGFTSSQACYDSRHLLHYFRLTPGKRMLFGMRGATRASEQAIETMRKTIRTDFDRMFPAWRDVETPYFWSGFVSLARSRTPFSGPLGQLENAWGAFNYHGNGVAMGSYAGRLLADQILGRTIRPAPHFMQRAPRVFELGRWRRALLPLVYHWYQLQDR